MLNLTDFTKIIRNRALIVHLSKKIILILLGMTFCLSEVFAQRHLKTSLDAEDFISERSLGSDIEFLSDSLCHGRGTATAGAVDASFLIYDRFRMLGMLPVGDSYIHSFNADGKAGHNVIGVLRNNDFTSSDKYIIVCAHYDNIGILEGRMFPGADSNASGVAAMLGIARMFKELRDLGRHYNHHIIFVGLDAKQLSMAGSQALWSSISSGRFISPISGRPITKKDISLFVNLDILGCSDSPIHSNRQDYLISLGNKHQDLLTNVNFEYKSYLDLGFDYYGSKSFTEMFLKKVSDQRVFLENGIYSVMFTSGITMKTNREGDTFDTIDLGLQKKRTCLIFHWMEKMIQLL